MTTGHEAYYYWDTVTGTDYKGSDSGHIVRYNPRLLLPNQSLYFGVDYGQGVVGEAAEDAPYILMAQWPEELPANTQKTGYDDSIEPNLSYRNASTTNFDNAKIQMELDRKYLQAKCQHDGRGRLDTG